ncbi:cupin domain-containing protein [Dactylosporangium sp. CA-139114]|uniref:cupin domain-containing protein n=1 Tax=Dactylosporangium sp. CA-139114 TaxID=3239931 RepID=UPI003D96AA6F
MMRPKHFDPVEAELADEPERFAGAVSRKDLFRHGEEAGTDVTGVYFAPGARTLPHVHSVDQVLYAVSGRGAVSVEGEVHELLPGDWMVIPAHAHHWHGSISEEESFTQMALKAGGTTRWLQADDEWHRHE